MSNKYLTMRKRQQEEVNAFPIGAAFSDKQFEEMMAKWGLTINDTDKISILPVPGTYIRKKDIPLYEDMCNRHTKELQNAIDSDIDGTGFIYDMFVAELQNHEYGYTYDWSDALCALGYTFAEIKADKKLYIALIKAADYCAGCD